MWFGIHIHLAIICYNDWFITLFYIGPGIHNLIWTQFTALGVSTIFIYFSLLLLVFDLGFGIISLYLDWDTTGCSTGFGIDFSLNTACVTTHINPFWPLAQDQPKAGLGQPVERRCVVMPCLIKLNKNIIYIIFIYKSNSIWDAERIAHVFARTSNNNFYIIFLFFAEKQ